MRPAQWSVERVGGAVRCIDGRRCCLLLGSCRQSWGQSGRNYWGLARLADCAADQKRQRQRRTRQDRQPNAGHSGHAAVLLHAALRVLGRSGSGRFFCWVHFVSLSPPSGWRGLSCMRRPVTCTCLVASCMFALVPWPPSPPFPPSHLPSPPGLRPEIQPGQAHGIPSFFLLSLTHKPTSLQLMEESQFSPRP